MTASRLRQLAGQLLSVGFDGTAAPAALRARIAASEVGGVMLFRPNIADPGQVAALVASLRGAAPSEAPLLVSIDQEGGVVQRVRAPATVWPPMLAVGGAGDSARTTAVGRALGEELAALGVGWDFAPVLDVHTNPANPVIGNRAFGTTPAGGLGAGAGVLARPRAARGWSAVASTSPVTATPAPIRTTSCRSCRTISSGCAGWSWRRSPPPPPPGWRRS